MRVFLKLLMQLAVLLFTASSCSLWGKRNQYTSSHSHRHQHIQSDSTTWQYHQQDHQWAWGQSQSRVIIHPEGIIHLHPDSGFTGAATLILIDLEQQQASQTAKNRTVGSETRSYRDSLHVENNTLSTQTREIQQEVPFKIPWWVWVVFLVGVVVLLLLWRLIEIKFSER